MIQPNPSTLLDLDPLCAQFAQAAAALEKATAQLEADLAAVRDRHADRIKALAEAEAAHEAAVRRWIEVHPEAFEKPRTLTLAGIEVGMKAQPGAVEFDDEESVIAALKRLYRDDPETLQTLVKTEETVRKDALRTLPADRFQKIGCRITGAGDSVVVRRTSGDVEKLIKAATANLVKAMLDQGGAKAKKARK